MTRLAKKALSMFLAAFVHASGEEFANPWNNSQILFMRHGHVNYTEGGYGPVDPALFPDIDTYEDIASMFSHPSTWPDMILVSPMRRTLQTMLWAFQHPLWPTEAIPVVEDPRIEEIPCTEGVWDANMGTPRPSRDWNITKLQDLNQIFPTTLFNSSLAGGIVHQDRPSWAGRKLIGEVAAKERNVTREYMGIRLPGIGYADFLKSDATPPATVSESTVDEWLAWTNPRGPRFCGDRAQNDFQAKAANLKTWFEAWADENPNKRLAVVTHSWLMHHVLGVCNNSKFMSMRAVNGSWNMTEQCVGGHIAPTLGLIVSV